MLSDEEREALRNFKSEYETCDHYSSDLIIELDDAETILNLIEKQSKEIEELKDIAETLRKENVSLYIERRQNENKIKAKIEVLDKAIKVNRNSAKNSDRVTVRLINDKINELYKAKEVLQSLLEKE